MAAVQRLGDPNSAGGLITSGDSSVRVNGRPIAVEETAVTPHQPCGRPGGQSHCNAKTRATVGSVKVNGKRVILSGSTDTCGHVRNGGSPDVRMG